MKFNKLAASLIVSGLLLPGAALATNGYFSHGYGMKSKGMAGAATAMTGDTFGGANNPATMVWAGDRLDVGVDWFRPIRGAERTGAPGGFMDGSADSGSNDFLVPEFGYNRMLNPNMSFGVTVYGNGGMNTDYSDNSTAVGTNLLGGNTKLGMDLVQLIIAPTLSYKINERHSVGVSPLFGYQRFKATGLQAFAGWTASGTTNNLTDKGYDSSTGWGFRLGYLGKLSDTVSFGAAYSTKMRMGKFDKYKELFAEDGGFDMPENYNFGLAIKVNPKTTVAVDYQRINYSGVRSVGNHMDAGGPLGASNGSGFGWGDVDVVKVGVEYQYSSNMTLRAGLSGANNPIQGRDITFNIIAPGVVQNHATLGFTYNMDKDSEVTMAYMHAFSNSVTAASYVPAGIGGTEKIKMHQDSVGIAYGRKF